MTTSETTFDVLVVGGGVTGAAIALEAARRGSSVVLIERGDFGASTSANSLKVLHGGLRDLKRLDVAAVRAGAREQVWWTELAPHLVDPLPFLLPTYRSVGQGRAALRAALTLADVLSPVPRGDRPFPGWRLLSRGEARATVPDLPGRITGAALWHEGQMYSAERLVLALVEEAVRHGAVARNHAEAVSLLRAGDGTVTGVRARDTLDGDVREVRARRTVVAAGSSSPSVAAALLGAPGQPARFSLALNVVLRDLGYPVAFAIRSAPPGLGTRQLVFSPWRGRTLLGTGHYPFDGDPTSFRSDAVDPEPLLTEANAAWDGPRLRAEDVRLVHAGLLPIRPGADSPNDLLRAPRVRDHSADGAPGLVSVLSVRFSYARRLAARAVDSLGLAGGVREAGRAGGPHPARTPLATSGSVEGSAPPLAGLPEDVRTHLARCYGSRASEVMGAVADLPGWDERIIEGEPVIFGQFVAGVRFEMARTTDDLVWRRTELGPRGLADARAEAMARRAIALEAGTRIGGP